MWCGFDDQIPATLCHSESLESSGDAFKELCD